MFLRSFTASLTSIVSVIAIAITCSSGVSSGPHPLPPPQKGTLGLPGKPFNIQCGSCSVLEVLSRLQYSEALTPQPLTIDFAWVLTPTQKLSMTGVILRAGPNYTIIILQLLLSGGNTQDFRYESQRCWRICVYLNIRVFRSSKPQIPNTQAAIVNGHIWRQ